MTRRKLWGALVIAAVLAWWPWPDFVTDYCNYWYWDPFCWVF